MVDAVFLSASIPDPKRGPAYAATSDTVAIRTAVSALVTVILGRRLLVWGGHPAITPMIWVVAEDIGVDYGSWVRLYQSRHFEEIYPEDNVRFQNVTYTDDVENNREKSLRRMREKMLSDYRFCAAVFIGGMGGIVDEFELFQRIQPNAKVVPLVSTGGATLEVAQRIDNLDRDLISDLDYVTLLHRHLAISIKEKRYRTPENQPNNAEDRLWKAPFDSPH